MRATVCDLDVGASGVWRTPLSGLQEAEKEEDVRRLRAEGG